MVAVKQDITIADEQDRRLLREILASYREGDALPKIATFQAAHPDDQKRFDRLEKSTLLTRSGDRYGLTLHGLQGCASMDAKTAYQRCEDLLRELQTGFREDPGSEWTVARFGTRFRRPAQEVSRILTFLKDAPGLKIQFSAKTGFADHFTIFENIHDFTLPEWHDNTSTTEREAAPVKLFCSYAAEDTSLMEMLGHHLTLLEREGLIQTWHRGMVQVDRDVEQEADRWLRSADIVLLLLSADYLASQRLYDGEVSRAIERHARGETVVLPIVLRSVDWNSGPLSRLQPLPGSGKPVTSWSNQDEAFTDIAMGIRAAARELKRRRTPAASSVDAAAALPASKEVSDKHAASGRRVGRLRGAGNDAIAKEDQLGFGSYVRAFADLIESPATKMPLTIGIFGSWGMGKSFLLKHVIGELQARREKREKLKSGERMPRVHVVEFNAWEYSATPVVWPGLVRRIMECMEESVRWGFPGHFLIKSWYRLRQLLLRRVALTIILSAGVAIASGYVYWRYGFRWREAYTAFTALGLAGAVAFVMDKLSKPLGQRITALFQSPDYGKYTDYMIATRDDLRFLANRLDRTKDRMLVVIDDLDRCEPQKAVEVLQAINLLLNFDNLLICLGVDARIITRAIEEHYKDMLGPAGTSGYEYLDKIVQIPFRIPTPGTAELETFIGKLLEEHGAPTPTAPALPPRVSAANPTEGTRTLTTLTPPLKSTTSDTKPTETTIQQPAAENLLAFSGDELEAFKQITRYLRPNPRHVKRLINVYRLVRTLAEYQNEQSILEDPAATVAWLAICGQWPYTAHAMLSYLDEMLERVEEHKLEKLPDEAPLPYLLRRVTPQLSAEKLMKFDHEPDLLRTLIRRASGGLDWKGLRTICRYTLNFNPTVESDFRLDVAIKLATEDRGEE